MNNNNNIIIMVMKKCENCDYEQELRSDRRARKQWRCYDCNHSNKLPFVIIAAILAIGSLGLVYSEEQDLPVEQPYDDKYCTFLAVTDHVIFTCSWKWFLDEIIMAELDPFDIPLKTTEIPQHNLDLADKIRLLLEKGNVTETEIPEPRIEDVLPDEPLTYEQRQIESSIKKLDECLRGLGAWAAYQTSNTIEYFVDDSRYSFAIRDNLSQNIHIKRILLAIEECDAMRTYERLNLIGDYELNKVLADIADKDYLGRGSAHPLEVDVTDQSDSMVATDPLTERDIADELADMEKIVQDLIDQRIYKDPYAELPDVDLQPAGKLCDTEGQPAPEGQYATRVCPLDDYNELILSNADTITYEYILGLQCEYYFGMYEHKVGTDDFPTWLNHCLPEVTDATN
jgi:hypothetical protein